MKVPGINGLGKTKGCEKAGNAILNSLKGIYSNEQGIPIDTKLLDLEEIHLDNSNLELTNNLIYKNSFKTFENKPRIIFLGGDHSVSYSTTRAFLDYCQDYGKEPCLIVFDAHPDCMKTVDKNSPTHEEWLRNLIEDGFPKENILLVGLRNSDPEETRFLKENKIKTISINQLLLDLQDTCDTLMEFSSGKELYVSIDIDFIDPVFAPATGYPEPGGLTSREFIYIVQRLKKIKKLKALDIVEINPDKDKGELTVKLGASRYQRGLNSVSVSIEQRNPESGEVENLLDLNGIVDETTPFDYVSRKDLVVQARKIYDGCINSLDKRERYVLERRFGLDGNGASSLDKVGKDLKMTREGVRRIQLIAIKKLRKYALKDKY